MMALFSLLDIGSSLCCHVVCVCLTYHKLYIVFAEVVGNLESTGMVPRDLTNQNTANRLARYG